MRPVVAQVKFYFYGTMSTLEGAISLATVVS